MKNSYSLAIVLAIISFIITPLVKKFAIRINAISVPKDERRIHKHPIPLLGGLAIYISFIIGVIIQRQNMSTAELGIILGATIIVIGGVIDDIKELKPRYKLGIQIIAAICLIICDVKISVVTNPFDKYYLSFDNPCFYIPITVLWIIGVTNAFNLIDGLDGLAAGIAFISSVSIFIIAILNNRYEAAMLTAMLSGAILGFLPYNFNPASIFMGDTGSQLLGFLLAAISIEGAIKSATAFVIAVPILALGLPIYDTLFAIIRRKVNGKPISQADRGHLHHRLLDMGLNQKQAVIVMYFISSVLGGISIIAMQISTQRAYFLLASVVVIIVIIAWKYGIFEHKE